MDIQNRLSTALMSSKGVRGSLILMVLGLALATSRVIAEPSFETRQACLVSGESVLPITVELAVSSEQRRQGLMARETLEENAGMLFIYEDLRPSRGRFWMYRTLIPLDIAFMDRAGTIQTILQMAPCPSSEPTECPTYDAGVSYVAALEMNQGFFSKHGIKSGDRLRLGADQCPD